MMNNTKTDGTSPSRLSESEASEDGLCLQLFEAIYDFHTAELHPHPDANPTAEIYGVIRASGPWSPRGL